MKGSQYSGEMKNGVIIGGIPYDLEPNRNTQDEGYGLRAGLKLEKVFGAVGVFMEPFIRYWRIQDSDVGSKQVSGLPVAVNGFYEPKNYTYEYGLKVGVSF